MGIVIDVRFGWAGIKAALNTIISKEIMIYGLFLVFFNIVHCPISRFKYYVNPYIIIVHVKIHVASWKETI